jgi:hypothetical protein
MTGAMRAGGAVLLLIVALGGAPAVAAENPEDAGGDARPPVRLTAGLLAGSGYAWKTGVGDVNRDVRFEGGGWAALGHVMPEVALLFPRVHLLASLSVRYQIIDGTTDIFTSQGVFHARRSAWAFFQKIGWFPRDASARLQPYVSLSTGRGELARLAPDPRLVNCGPAQNQECVDTVTIGPWFLGAGGGMRARLAEHLDALLSLDARLGFDGALDHRGYNLDLSVGLAAVF